VLAGKSMAERGSMRQLSADDATFLYADTDHSNANITLVLIYDPSRAPHGRIRFQGLLQHVASRLHLAPLFRQRLMRVPLELDVPYWVEDERFDLEYHVRHVALPEPGDWRQLCTQVSRIHARPLDLSRPLWELYLVDRLDSIEGLPENSFAILLKVHHTALHGSEGADLATLLHDTQADAPPLGPPEPWFPEPPPPSTDVLIRAVRHNLTSPLLGSRPLARAVASLGPGVLRLVGDMLRHPEQFPTARFNTEVSPHRVFETRRFELAQLERIRALVRGATLDDAVIAICGGALRRYLEHHDELPLSTMVALAAPAVHGVVDGPADWESALRRVPLHTDIASPIERLRAVLRESSRAEPASIRTGGNGALAESGSSQAHAPVGVLAIAARALGAAARAAGRGVTIANCTLVNAPGPAQPLYLYGARMTYFSAMMPVADGIGLTFAITTYDGRVLISPTACREQLPDPAFLAQCIRESFEEYLKCARSRPSAKARRRGSHRAAATRPRVERAGPPRST
jgi:WS/DGAT/MGAT family acyltransferase